jgi:hypothetical protein
MLRHKGPEHKELMGRREAGAAPRGLLRPHWVAGDGSPQNHTYMSILGLSSVVSSFCAGGLAAILNDHKLTDLLSFLRDKQEKEIRIWGRVLMFINEPVSQEAELAGSKSCATC